MLGLCAPRGGGGPPGGNTGLVGGGVPLHGELVLSLRRLDALGPVDPVAAQVTAGAARRSPHSSATPPAGLAYGVDWRPGAATIGGTVATNAGGLHVSCDGEHPPPAPGHRGGDRHGRVLRHLEAW